MFLRICNRSATPGLFKTALPVFGKKCSSLELCNPLGYCTPNKTFALLTDRTKKINSNLYGEPTAAYNRMLLRPYNRLAAPIGIPETVSPVCGVSLGSYNPLSIDETKEINSAHTVANRSDKQHVSLQKTKVVKSKNIVFKTKLSKNRNIKCSRYRNNRNNKLIQTDKKSDEEAPSDMDALLCIILFFMCFPWSLLFILLSGGPKK